MPSITAGLNQVAVVNLDASFLPTLATNSIMSLYGTVSINGGGFVLVNTRAAFTGLTNGGQASTTFRLVLTQGSTYVFAAGVGASQAVGNASATCHGTAMVVQQ